MIDTQKVVYISSTPSSYQKHWKNIYLKLDLPDWCIFLCTFCRIWYISSTCNLPRFNLSVVIFLILLLSSDSAKKWFKRFWLISETIFLFTAKISNALRRPTSRDIKSFLTSLIRGVKPYIIERFSGKKFPATTRAWTSFQTFNFFLFIFSGKIFFIFN